MTQAGKSKLVSVAVTLHNAWAVDSAGNVFFLAELWPLPDQPLSTSWVALRSLGSSSIGWAGSALMYGGLTTHIVHIFASSSSDWMVCNFLTG